MDLPIVFISSTCEDLRLHRQAAREAALRCDFHPRMMEYFAASGNPPLAECLARVDQADVLVVIIAHRFGWVPDEQGGRKDRRKSITWLECQRARDNGQEVLAFLVDEPMDPPWPADRREGYQLIEAAERGDASPQLIDEVQRNIARLKDFKQEICDQGIIVRFTTPDSLQIQVLAALNDWRERHPEFDAARGNAQPPCDPTRYLLALNEDTAYINIRGLNVRSGQASRFAIDELYIPLTTTAAGQRGDAESVKGKGERSEMAAEHVALDRALQSRHLVILGDPGSGKTTFVNRIAHLLCRARLEPDQWPRTQQTLGLSDALFPVLIRVAELVEHIRTARAQQQGPLATDAPGWLVHYLATECREARHGLTDAFLEQQLTDGRVLLLLDGLDEAPSESERENISRLIRQAVRVFDGCRFVVTSRPAAYHEDVVLDDFDQVRIDHLQDQAIAEFLGRWYGALFHDSPRQAREHHVQLLEAMRQRPDIRRLARNPVMLTALGVVHWNEQRLPEQRADLYESIIGWLSKQRKMRPERPPPETTVNLLQELALSMQTHPEGRQVQVPRRSAAEFIAPECRDQPEDRRVAWAERFLEQEELDSGIVVRRGHEIRFWHLSFQEFLAARALASRDDDQRRDLLTSAAAGGELPIYQPEWREMVLLLAGVLYRQGPRRVDRLFATLLDQLGDQADLARRARCAAILGAAVQDLAPVKYQPGDARYQQLLDAVFGIFDPVLSAGVPVRDRIQAADALGRAGDPRFVGATREKNWIRIPAGQFLMGSQKDDPHAPNYDEQMFEDDEGPVHTVRLDAYEIARYPVTVEEYAHFVDQDGYRQQQWWEAGGFGKENSPGNWEDQLQHPSRPVVNVSWYEAAAYAAYAAWAECRLPTEAQWERAARGTEGRRYPWANEDPDDLRLNYDGKIGHPTPVGIYPRGNTPEGICDLAGNVWEWCWDAWDKKYYHRSPPENPSGPETGSSRVLRGGGWHVNARYCRSACRYDVVAVNRRDCDGFRLVRLLV